VVPAVVLAVAVAVAVVLVVAAPRCQESSMQLWAWL
jgi:hypothetical protein